MNSFDYDKGRTIGLWTPLTVDRHEDGGASATLVLRHGVIHVGEEVQGVALHPFPVADQNGVGSRLDQGYREEIRL